MSKIALGAVVKALGATLAYLGILAVLLYPVLDAARGGGLG